MKELFEKNVGKKAMILINKLLIEVIVKDIRNSYGRIQYLITPVAGKNECWVNEISLLN